ncbi:hypothetical protein FV139_02955 [Parahaliea maris]|uniref:Uncharacterized protein n=1 Tax=Parahaliea maris TaxID=2716870 RepID=A0A5C9A8J7_9GAMM|nr:hypothetical protein [Parahaliea maris]TXS96459.1 hypothetical protein FV139_02955 [Parahaliea maris]
MAIAFRYVGPVVAKYGFLLAKVSFPPENIIGEHYWAQGLFEPGARELMRIKEFGAHRRAYLHSNVLFMDKLAAMETRVMALELLEYRHVVELGVGKSIVVTGAITKLLASELRKDIYGMSYRVEGRSSIEFHNLYLNAALPRDVRVAT